MIDDKYLGLTAYLRQQHDLGNNFLTMTFQKVQELCGLSTCSASPCSHCKNDASDKLALGWMLADYVIVDCNQDKAIATFQYNPDKVEHCFLSGHSKHCGCPTCS